MGDHNPINVLIERRRMQVTDKQVADFSLPPCEPNADMTGSLARRTKRLHVAQQQVEDECEALVARGLGETNDWIQKDALGKIMDRIVELEVWQQFPEFTGKPFEIYSDWRIGPKKSDSEIRNLAFNFAHPSESVGLKELVTRSTRSDDVNVGAIRHG